MIMWHCYTWPVLHTHFSPYSFSPRKNEYILVFHPERSVYTHVHPPPPPPRKDQYILIFPRILGGKSEFILKFPPSYSILPFALIDYTRAITSIRGRPFGDFCRAFDAEE